MGQVIQPITSEKVKKRILIVSHCMRIGGVERSLIGLLNAFDYSRYEVDLFLFLHDGELMPLIPNQVNLLPEVKKYTSLLSSTATNIKNGYWDVLLGKAYASLKARLLCRKHHCSPNNMVYFDYQQRFTCHALPEINPDVMYDLAISFLTPHYIVSRKVHCKKKIAWIHTDYSFFDFDRKSELTIWGKYDHIASISDSCTNSFAKQFPELASKIVLIENILSPDFVRKQADIEDVSEEMSKEAGVISLCSVGRFTHPKNLDNVPFICKHLIDSGVSVKWYLIGYGGEEALIRAKIAEAGMQQHVIILGKKENPYPYIKACDMYVQPSRFEGKAVTVREAQILCKPVVITRFATSDSQLRDGMDGVIVPMDNEGCAGGIRSLIADVNQQQELICNCKRMDYGNELEVEKIYQLIP